MFVLDKVRLERENQQLKARIARLEQCFKQMDASLISMGSRGTNMPTANYQEMLNAFYESPEQSVASIQSDGVKAMLDKAPIEMFYDAGYVNDMWIDEYAQQLRQQGDKDG